MTTSYNEKRREHHQWCPLLVLCSAVLLPKAKQNCSLLDSLPPSLFSTSTISLTFSRLPLFLPFILILYTPFLTLCSSFPPFATFPLHSSPTFLHISISIPPSFFLFTPLFFLFNPVLNSFRFLPPSFPSLCQSAHYMSPHVLPTASCPHSLPCCIIQMCSFHFPPPSTSLRLLLEARGKWMNSLGLSFILICCQTPELGLQDDGVGWG